MQNEIKSNSFAPHVMGCGNGVRRKRRICGAKTRKGSPCQNTRLYKNGRCKNHGGLSTGPRTAEGRARALENLRKLGIPG